MLQYWVSAAKKKWYNANRMEAFMDNNVQILNNGDVTQKWYQKHKKKLIIGGVVLVTAAATAVTCVLLKKRILIKSNVVGATANGICAETLISAENIIERARPTSPVHVEPFIRKLPEGWHPSKTQLELAETLGYTVPSGYTFVKPFTKYGNLLNCA